MDNAKGIDVMMPRCDLIEYSDNYSKPWGNLWRYYRNDPNDNITKSESLRSKIKITRKNPRWRYYKKCSNSSFIKILIIIFGEFLKRHYLIVKLVSI